MAKQRKFYKSAISGKFVSRTYTRRSPRVTITQKAAARKRR